MKKNTREITESHKTMNIYIFFLSIFSPRFDRGNCLRSTNCADTECNFKTEILAFSSGRFIKFHNTKRVNTNTNKKKKKKKQKHKN